MTRRPLTMTSHWLARGQTSFHLIEGSPYLKWNNVTILLFFETIWLTNVIRVHLLPLLKRRWPTLTLWPHGQSRCRKSNCQKRKSVIHAHEQSFIAAILFPLNSTCFLWDFRSLVYCLVTILLLRRSEIVVNSMANFKGNSFGLKSRKLTV